MRKVLVIGIGVVCAGLFLYLHQRPTQEDDSEFAGLSSSEKVFQETAEISSNIKTAETKKYQAGTVNANINKALQQGESSPNSRAIARIDLIEKRLDKAMGVLQDIEARLRAFETGPGLGVDSGWALDTDIRDSAQDDLTFSSAPERLWDALARSGLELDTIEQVRSFLGENRMALLKLRDEAAREGWIDSPAYKEALATFAKPDNELRSQFGDEVYDHYLYASGKPNRVVIKDVYPNSEAAEADLQSGDIILGYASMAIFSMNELRQATTGGQSGEPVSIEFLRQGMPMSAIISRGPIGIEVEASLQQPGHLAKY